MSDRHLLIQRITDLEGQMQEKDKHLQEKEKQLQEKDKHLQEKDKQLQEAEAKLQHIKKAHRHEIDWMERCSEDFFLKMHGFACSYLDVLASLVRQDKPPMDNYSRIVRYESVEAGTAALEKHLFDFMYDVFSTDDEAQAKVREASFVYRTFFVPTKEEATTLSKFHAVLASLAMAVSLEDKNQVQCGPAISEAEARATVEQAFLGFAAAASAPSLHFGNVYNDHRAKKFAADLTSAFVAFMRAIRDKEDVPNKQLGPPNGDAHDAVAAWLSSAILTHMHKTEELSDVYGITRDGLCVETCIEALTEPLIVWMRAIFYKTIQGEATPARHMPVLTYFLMALVPLMIAVADETPEEEFYECPNPIATTRVVVNWCLKRMASALAEFERKKNTEKKLKKAAIDLSNVLVGLMRAARDENRGEDEATVTEKWERDSENFQREAEKTGFHFWRCTTNR